MVEVPGFKSARAARAAWAAQTALVVGVLLAAGSPGAALGGPPEDYARGLTAYQRGDVVTAMSVLRGSARAGHAPSQVLLAFILDRADFAEEAFALYRDAAAQGDAEGHFNLGNAYLHGRGIAKDEKQALQHFSKAADADHAGAIVLIAEWTAKDHPLLADLPPEQAVAAVRRAAEAGHLPSMDTLAQAYRTGRWQLSVDTQQAVAWQARATTLRAQRAAVKPPPPPKAAS